MERKGGREKLNAREDRDLAGVRNKINVSCFM